MPAGGEGICNPSTFTETDHRGTLKVDLYRMKVAGATDAALNDLVKNGGIKMEKVKTDRPAAQARMARLVRSGACGATTLNCHPPRKRGIQYAAASRLIAGASGILGHPLSRVTTTESDRT